ncbi:MAG: alpha-hydroxy-acid oxidizing protein, partial [Gemmatirosa sp.]
MTAPVDPDPAASAPPHTPPAAGVVPYGMAMQLQVYDPARAGEPLLPMSPEEWERRARETLADGPFGYVAGGAGAEDTVRANREAFARHRIVPRMLRDVSRRALGIELLGHRLPAPVLLAPIGVLGILHAEGERAPARAAA